MENKLNIDFLKEQIKGYKPGNMPAKTNEDILKGNLKSDFDMLKDFGMLRRVLQAMDESNLNFIESNDDRHYCVKCGARRKQEFMKIITKKLHRTQWECLECKTS